MLTEIYLRNAEARRLRRRRLRDPMRQVREDLRHMTTHKCINGLASLSGCGMGRKPQHDMPVQARLNDTGGLKFMSSNSRAHGAHTDDGIETP